MRRPDESEPIGSVSSTASYRVRHNPRWTNWCAARDGQTRGPLHRPLVGFSDIMPSPVAALATSHPASHGPVLTQLGRFGEGHRERLFSLLDPARPLSATPPTKNPKDPPPTPLAWNGHLLDEPWRALLGGTFLYSPMCWVRRSCRT